MKTLLVAVTAFGLVVGMALNAQADAAKKENASRVVNISTSESFRCRGTMITTQGNGTQTKHFRCTRGVNYDQGHYKGYLNNFPSQFPCNVVINKDNIAKVVCNKQAN